MKTHISVIVYKRLPNQEGAERTELGMYVSYPICFGVWADRPVKRSEVRVDFPLGVDCEACIQRATKDGLV